MAPQPDPASGPPTPALRGRIAGPHPTQPPETDPSVVTIYHGFADGALLCTFSVKCRFLLEALGIPYRIIEIDLEDKPSWFGEISPKLEVPVGYVQGELMQESSVIAKAVLDLAERGFGHASARAFLSRESSLSEKDAGGLIGSFFGYLCSEPGGEGEPDARDKWEACVRLFEEAIRSSGGPFLCGSAPGPRDCEAVVVELVLPLLEVSHGWKCSERAPLVAAWIDRLSRTDLMKWSCAGTSDPALTRPYTLGKIMRKAPHAVHLKAAQERAQRLADAIDHAVDAPGARTGLMAPLPGSVEVHSPAREQESGGALASFSAEPGITGATKARPHKLRTQEGEGSARSSSLALQPVVKPSEQKLANFSHGRARLSAAVQNVSAVKMLHSGSERKNAEALKSASAIKTRMHVASSRRMNRCNPKNWYFLLLEASWLRLLLAYVCVYVFVWLLNLGFSVVASGGISNPDDETAVYVAAWSAMSNIVAIGATGSYVPETFGAFSLGILQQMQGILLQAFLFSVAVTRFQMPQSDLFFSDKLLFTNRDDVPHLIFRIGNLRCNMIFHPNVCLTMLRQHRTKEGESYVRMIELPVEVPTVMGGSITITHQIGALNLFTYSVLYVT